MHTESAAQIKAITAHKKEVLLFDDGTWRYADQLKINKAPLVLPTPPWSGATLSVNRRQKPVRFKQLSAKRNSITDVEAWLQKHRFKLPTWEVPNSFRGIKGNCPARTPFSYKKSKLISAMHSASSAFLIYGIDFSSGRYLIITDPSVSKVRDVLDFRSYMLSKRYKKADRSFVTQSINWVMQDENTLYVSSGHRTYARSSRGMNAYISALRLKDYKLLWRSRPLVSNSRNFVIVGDLIITGYGFTAEPDFLFALDKHTGRVLAKKKLKTGPDFILWRDNKLYVRTYDMDYVFAIK